MATTGPATIPSAAAQEALHALLREVLPRQGAWSDEEYLWLTDRARRPLEFTDGRVEVLPMPTDTHQVILLFLYRLLYAHVRGRRRVPANRARGIGPGRYRSSSSSRSLKTVRWFRTVRRR